jgi:protein SCO1/2
MKFTLLFSIALLVSLSAFAQKETSVKSCCNPMLAANTTQKETLPGTSIYQFDHSWKNQYNEAFQLIDLKGKPVVMTMIFTHCEYACPMMVNDLKKVEKEFTKKHEDVKFVLISFDHLRDTPERLKEYAETQNLGENWILLHGDAEQIKEISLVLDISYEQMESGAFAHANKKLVLDENGSIVFSLDGLQTKAKPVVEAVNKVL